jgi:NAD(P)H-dependent flavin oxidoreductase YrpB (nitropropane dioxygenase family)
MLGVADTTEIGPFSTRFTRAFGIRHPIAGAGLAFAGMTPDLAISISKAGGIGALGVGFMPPEELRAKIHALRAAGCARFNINFITCFDNDTQSVSRLRRFTGVIPHPST